MSSVKSGAIPQDIGPLVATYIIELSFGIAVFELFNIPILFILSIPGLALGVAILSLAQKKLYEIRGQYVSDGIAMVILPIVGYFIAKLYMAALLQ